MTAQQAHKTGSSTNREVEYSDADFLAISDLLREISGIRMPETNRALVYSRLAKRVRALGLERFKDYIAFVRSERDSEERTIMVETLTTNTTRFFREDYHYDIVARDLLPTLVKKAKSGQRVRLWSAACSTGEEVYSLAAVILQHFEDALAHDVRILATDINRAVLARAEAGLYPPEARATVRSEYETALFSVQPGAGGQLSVRPELRKLVTFRYMNFMEPWPVRGPFDAIFCRNAMIYMDPETQARIWTSFSEVLPKGGYLFIGHSERIGPELSHVYELAGKTTFRRL